MKVLINAASAHMGGSVTYLRNVLRWLPLAAPDDTFVVYAPAATLAGLEGAGAAPNVELRTYPFPDTSGPARLYFDHLFLPRRIVAEGYDLLFSSTGFGTFFSPCPQMLLVRNLAYFDRAFQEKYRELGRSLRKNTLRRWHSLLSIQRADVVLFPTHAMQQMVGSHVSLRRKQTAVLHYGFDHEAFFRSSQPAPDFLRDIEAWKRAGYAILVNVSTYAVHKNYETLMDALPRLADAGVRVKLLLTISRDKTTDTAEYDALQRRMVERGAADAVVELGYVPHEQLNLLYRAADAYVFPSFSESFGHTMVEAMACGLPVVAADTAVNREVCGPAGVYFRAFDPGDCASMLQSVLCDGARRQVLSAASAQRAHQFSWRDYATRLVNAFHEAARRRK